MNAIIDVHFPGIKPNKLVPPLHGALLKNEQDIQLFERLAFLSRRENG
jgi:hypothetical protein